MGSEEVTVRAAMDADVKPLAAVMARAFYDDPPFMWMLPDEATRLARAGRVFATMLRAEAMRHGGVEVARAGREIVGGAIWLPPGHSVGVREALGALSGYGRAFGRRLGRAAGLVRALGRAHPREPHWYLYAIGVDPSAQGQGVASLLLRSRLRRCDEAGLPAYLESSKLTNVPLYEHFGFEVTGAPPLPGGAPVMTAMWRHAASLPAGPGAATGG